MKIRTMIYSVALLLAFQVSSAFAGPGAQVGNGQGPAGSGTPVNITVNFEGGGGAVGGQFRILYDDTNLTPDIDNGCLSANWTCSVQSPGVLQYVSNIVLAGLPTELIGTIAFDISAAAVGTYPINVSDQLYGDAGEGDVPPSGTVNGQIVVQGAAYSSNPAPGPVTVGPVIQNDTDPTAPVAISNSGAAGTTLTGSCSETSDPDGVFSYSNTAFSVLQGDPAHTVTVICDSAGSIATHTGTMECTHNGDDSGEASPAVYNLSCQITAGPQPAYSSNPADGAVINMSAPNQGDPITPVNIAISNSGAPGTTLTGTCSRTSGDTEISIADGTFSVLQGGGADIQVVSCDSSAEGDYSATLSCPHNGSNTSPATYTVNCSVGPPPPAVFGSNPADGAVVDMTNGQGVLTGDPSPTSVLQLSNTAGQAGLDLEISCTAGGDTEISAMPDVTGAMIAPGGSLNVTFSCDTAAPGNYSASYSCDYIEDGSMTPTGSASYTYTCEVRDPMSDVVPNPADGSQLVAALQPGGSASVNVTFNEIADEGVDGSVDCSLADGTDFVIDTSLPAVVPAGGSLMVSVTGTDPQTDVDSISDTLNCTYTDTDNPEGVDVSYPIVMSIGGAATQFVTTVSYAGGAVPENPAEVSLTCNSGLPLQQSFTGDVTFVVLDLLDGTNCTIVVGGVNSDWVITGAESDDVPTGDSCVFLADPGNTYFCDFTAVPAPFQFSTTMDWAISAEANGGTGDSATVVQTCVNVWDIDADTTTDYIGPVTPAGPFDANPIVTPELTPDPFGTTVCSAVFDDQESGLEIENGCLPGVSVPLGTPDPACTIMVTAFYEGIPTLSQYGMAILVLLMLGIGMAGFRRYS